MSEVDPAACGATKDPWKAWKNLASWACVVLLILVACLVSLNIYRSVSEVPAMPALGCDPIYIGILFPPCSR